MLVTYKSGGATSARCYQLKQASVEWTNVMGSVTRPWGSRQGRNRWNLVAPRRGTERRQEAFGQGKGWFVAHVELWKQPRLSIIKWDSQYLRVKSVLIPTWEECACFLKKKGARYPNDTLSSAISKEEINKTETKFKQIHRSCGMLKINTDTLNY